MERYPDEVPVLEFFENRQDTHLLDRAVDVIRNSSAIDESYDVANRYCQTAHDLLNELPSNSSRESLQALTSYVQERDR